MSAEAVPAIIAEYVREKLKDDVEALLDDPHGVLQGMDPKEIVAHVHKLECIARLVNVPLLKLLMTAGTNVEYARLMEIIMKARAAA
jgi:hypothetical protein